LSLGGKTLHDILIKFRLAMCMSMYKLLLIHPLLSIHHTNETNYGKMSSVLNHSVRACGHAYLILKLTGATEVESIRLPH
jgi:hypothetical protein